MNEPGDIPLTLSTTPDTRPCGIISIIPTLGMSSCRGRAEAFARRLSSKLRTLGSQTDDDPISQEVEPIINGSATNTWMTSHESDQTVTDLQPLRHESDSFFDFDCELESPGSPVDECEYLRLIETASNTPHNSAAESGYVCASAASSQSSSDGPYFDVENVDNLSASSQKTKVALAAAEHADYVNSLNINGNATATELLLNEQNHQQSNEGSASINIATYTEEQSKEIATEALPTMDEADATMENHIEEQNHEQLTALEMAKIQDQIISELQNHSEKLSVSISSATLASTEDNNCDKLEIDCQAPVHNSNATELQTIESFPEVMHTITNGHAENGEKVLMIETIEVIVNEQQQAEENHLQCIESQAELPTSTSTEVVEEKPLVNESQCCTKENEKTPKVEEKARIHHSVLETTDDEDDCRPQRVRRCSSLKTGKTPPGTPGRKKIVRFADVLGLDLADIKTFLDEVPHIPKSAFEDLEILDAEPPMQLGPKSDKLLMPLFQQPGGLPTFLDMVREKQVSLENAAITDPINQTISGSVRVRNLDFHKSVHIRYTLDGWRRYADLQANYVQNSCDGFSDKYGFTIFGNSLHIGQRLEFAVRFQCKGQQFWDNNYGANYCFQCLPTRAPLSNPIQQIVQSHHTNTTAGMLSPSVGDAWCSSFY